MFGDAIMVAAMCLSIFKNVKHRLGIWKESKTLLKMANGTVVPSQAVWRGVMQLEDIKVEGSFEVFDSRGSWAFLLGKPLLHLFKAKQDFAMDTVTICSAQGLNPTILCNEIAQPRPGNNTIQMNLTLDIKQVMKESESILKRQTDPWKPEHVARLLKEVTLGWDILGAEHDAVQATIAEFADFFALAVKEINAIPGAVHKLNIPKGATFRTKIPLRSYNPDQRAFMEVKIDEMLEAGVIRKIHSRDVWCVAQTVLAQKTHKGEGLTLDELKHCVNNQCIEHGLPSEFEMPPQP